MTPPLLIRAYRETRYEADGAVARIGRRSAAIDAVLTALGSREGAFLTGWNPGSRRYALGLNRRWMRALIRHVEPRLRYAPGQGGWRDWWEEHALLAADPRRCAVLARRYRQRAMVVVRLGQVARLVILVRAP